MKRVGLLILATGLFSGLLGAAPPAPVVSPGSFDARLENVNQTMTEMLQRLESLHQEIQSLRGTLEEHEHTLDSIKARQRQTYLEQQERQQQERRAANPPAAPVSPPIAAPTSPAVPSSATTAISSGSGSGPGVTPPVAPVAPTVKTPPPAAASSAPVASEEQAAYDRAFNLLRSGSYDEAITALRSFLQSFGGSGLAANAQYWVGEAYYVTRRFNEALPQFKRVVEGYPDSPKGADALLKMGYIHDEQGNATEARKALEEVISRFPQSTAAQLATKRLAKVKK